MLDNRINALTTYYFQFDTSPLIRPYPTPRIKLDFGGSTLSPSSSCRFANRLQTPNATQIICYLLGGWKPLDQTGTFEFEVTNVMNPVIYAFIYFFRELVESIT